MRENEQTAPPPGVIATLTAGFDLTAKHLWLAALPVVLDLLFWMGPRLSFGGLIEQMVAFWQREAIATGLDEELLLELAPNTNLFTSLSVPVIGVPTYIVGSVPDRTPFTSSSIELENVWIWALLLILFSLLGLLLTAVYLALVAQVVKDAANSSEVTAGRRALLKHVVLSWLKLVGVVILLFIIGFVLYLPLLIISGLLAMFSGSLATFILFTGPVFAIWLLFYLCFVPHGLILQNRPFWRAIVESFQLVQRNLLATLGLLISVLVINRALDALLAAAESGSWFTAVGILGHAYISTALVVATFVFYRYRYAIMAGQSG